MITFRQFITEVFDKPLPWKAGEVRKHPYITKYSFDFVYEDTPYKVTIRKEFIDDVLGYEIDLYANGKTWFTGQNQPFKIYATLIDIVNKFFKTHKLKSGNVVYMLSADPKTGPIYKKFAKEFAKQYGGGVESFINADHHWKVIIK